jgi:hypothetical protein
MRGSIAIQETIMNKKLLAIGFASALAIGAASPSVAAPVMSSTNVVKAAPDHVVDVQWRRHRHVGPGLAAGAIIGATAGIIAGAAAAPYYRDPYGPYYYEAPVASYDYSDTYYAPQYVAPAPGFYGGWNSCRDERFGTRGNCNHW